MMFAEASSPQNINILKTFYLREGIKLIVTPLTFSPIHMFHILQEWKLKIDEVKKNSTSSYIPCEVLLACMHMRHPLDSIRLLPTTAGYSPSSGFGPASLSLVSPWAPAIEQLAWLEPNKLLVQGDEQDVDAVREQARSVGVLQELLVF